MKTKRQIIYWCVFAHIDRGWLYCPDMYMNNYSYVSDPDSVNQFLRLVHRTRYLKTDKSVHFFCGSVRTSCKLVNVEYPACMIFYKIRKMGAYFCTCGREYNKW